MKTNRPPRYLAQCNLCYSQRCETDNKRIAERWATSHGNAYGHGVTLLDRRTQNKESASSQLAHGRIGR